MPKPYKSIYKQLMISVLVATVIPILIIGFSMYYILQENIHNKVDLSIESTLEQVNINIGNKLKDVQSTANYYATNRELKDLLQKNMDMEAALKVDDIMMKYMSGENRGRQQVTIGGNNKQLFINWQSDGRTILENLTSQLRQTSWYREALASQSRELWIIDMRSVDKYNKDEKYISLAKIIDQYNEKDHNIGFVLVSILKSSISELFEDAIRDSSLTGFVIDEKGNLVTDIDGEDSGAQVIGQAQNTRIQETKNGSFVGEINGLKQVVYYKQIPQMDWVTVLTMPYSYYMAEVRQVILLIGGIVVGGVILAIFISTIFSNYVLKPVKELVNGMKEISKGNLDYQVQVSANNEIGILADQFNTMSIQIKQLLNEQLEQEKKQQELELMKKNMELQMLRAQINPHFLFNTLNSIKCLALINNAKQVAQMIGNLGKLLEATVGRGAEYITIKEEVDILDAYVALQKTRYGNKIEVTYEIEESVKDYYMPQFILQPIVENAIQHAFSQSKKRGDITVYARDQEDQVVFEIRDNGIGISNDALAAFNKSEQDTKLQGFSGIGMSNIKTRINMLFGKKYGMVVERAEGESGGTRVYLNIPKIVTGGNSRD